MLPDSYVCSSCREKFDYRVRQGFYYVGRAPLDKDVAEEDLLRVPVRPAWCKTCEAICVAEDIAALRAFEASYGAARSGRPIEYPVHTEFVDSPTATRLVEPYLRWRMGRRRAARALCCGGSDFQFLDVETPLFRHAGCEYGFIEPIYIIGGGSGPGPGVRSRADLPVFSTEGELVGLMTWRKSGESRWEIEPASYPPCSSTN